MESVAKIVRIMASIGSLMALKMFLTLNVLKGLDRGKFIESTNMT